MSDKTCWYKTIGSGWKTGFFHQWSTYYEEFESGPGPYPAAIIEDATDSQIHVVYAGFVSFSPDAPDASDASDDPKPSCDEESVEKPKRFEPRLVWEPPNSMLVQVHPETIEVFNDKFEYLCQVRWVGGWMDYYQSGLPLVALEEMFKEANK